MSLLIDNLQHVEVLEGNGINLESVPQPQMSILQGNEIQSELKDHNSSTPNPTRSSSVRSRLQLTATLFALFVRVPQASNSWLFLTIFDDASSHCFSQP